MLLLFPRHKQKSKNTKNPRVTDRKQIMTRNKSFPYKFLNTVLISLTDGELPVSISTFEKNFAFSKLLLLENFSCAQRPAI